MIDICHQCRGWIHWVMVITSRKARESTSAVAIILMQDSEVQNGIGETQPVVLQTQCGQLRWGADLAVVERVHLEAGGKE